MAVNLTRQDPEVVRTKSEGTGSSILHPYCIHIVAVLHPYYAMVCDITQKLENETLGPVWIPRRYAYLARALDM